MAKRLNFKYHSEGELPDPSNNYIFVFGSNEAGLHQYPNSIIAHKQFGAELLVGKGCSGNSYAIATKSKFINPLGLDSIAANISAFREFTHTQPNRKFWVSNLCDEYKMHNPWDIVPMFRGCNKNCIFPRAWRKFLN